MSWKGGGSWGGAGAGAGQQWGGKADSWGAAPAAANAWGDGAAAPAAANAWGGGAAAAAWGAAPAAAWGGAAAAAPKVVKPPSAGGKGVAGAISNPMLQSGAKGAGKAAAKGPDPAVAAAATAAAALKAKLAKNTASMTSLEATITTALESSQKAVDNDKATAASLKASMTSLETAQKKSTEFGEQLTKDCEEARKGGSANINISMEMSKLLVKAKTQGQRVTLMVAKMKPRHMMAEKAGELKAKEAKDTAAFKAVLTKARTDVNAVEVVANGIVRQATPVLANPPEGEALDTKVAAIEKSAGEAMAKFETCRTAMMEHIKTIQTYAPESKKASHELLLEQQKKLQEHGNVCRLYMNFKKEMPKIIENQKVVTEVTDKLSGHDAAVAKATKLADAKDLKKAQIATLDETLEPVVKAIREALASINMKTRGADAGSQVKLAAQRTKAEELKKKLDAINLKIKVPKDKFNAEDAFTQVQENFNKAQEGYKLCQDAEMPFLTGVEVLPEDEMDMAIKACTEAVTTTSTAINAGRGYLKLKVSEAGMYEKELADSTKEKLAPFLKKFDDLDVQVTKYRRDMAERKTAALLSGALEAAEVFEKKVKVATREGKKLASKDLEDESVETIKEIAEKTKIAVNEANTAGNTAKTVLATKQREAKAAQNSPAILNIFKQLNADFEKLSALRNAMTSADKIVKAKGALTEGGAKVTEAEAEVAKAQKLAPKEGATLTHDSVKALDEAVDTAIKSIRLAHAAISPHFSFAPTKAKAELQKLIDRKTEAQAAVDKVKADTKEQRAETLTDHFIAEGEAGTAGAEEGMAKMEAAEAPFLVGSTLTLKAQQDALAKCAEAGAEVTVALAKAKKFQEQKVAETRPFGEEFLKKAKESFAGMADRLRKVAGKLAALEKDSKERTKACKLQESTEKVDEVAAAVTKTVAAAEPFTKEGGDTMSEADAEKPLQAYMELEAETVKQISILKKVLGDRQREQTGNAEQLAVVKELQARVAKFSEELAPAKKAAAPHEQRSLGTRLLKVLKEEVGGLEAEVKKAADALAPLLEHGGEEFLVSTSIKTLVSVLQAHMKEKELDEAALFKEVAKGRSASEQAFVKYLAGLDAATGKDDVSAFTEARRVAIFKRLASSGSKLTADDFTGMFNQTYTCIKATTVTNQFEAEGSETVCKVEPNTEVALSGAQKATEAGLVRSECEVDGKAGWVTVRQDKGAAFLKPSVPFAAFCNTGNHAIQVATNAVQKVLTSLATKSKQGGPATTGPLKEARDEMAKLKDEIVKAEKAIGELRKDFGTGQRDHQTKERTEVNAHIESRNLKEAAQYTEAVQEQVVALEAAVKAVEDAGASIAALTGDELAAFATPATCQENVEKLAAGVAEKVTAVKEALKEQTEAVNKATPQSGGTALAKKTLRELAVKTDDAARKPAKTVQTVKAKVKAIVTPKMEPTAEAIRKHAQAKKQSGEELFEKLKDGDKVPEAAFIKLISSLKDLGHSAEIAKLISRTVQADGISKDNFMKYVVLYFKVVRGIAFTDNMDIKKCKTLRKAEEGEVLQVLEGPVEDAVNGMTRVRVKSCAEPITEGWVTIAGSKGTAFLQKTYKPYPKPAPKPVVAEAEEKK